MKLRAGLERVCIALPLMLFIACAPERYIRSADREVGELLGDFEHQVLDSREDWVQYPLPEPPPTEAPPTEAESPEAGTDSTDGTGSTSSGGSTNGEVDPAPALLTGVAQDDVEPGAGPDVAASESADPDADGPLVQIDLAAALNLAVQGNRNYIAQRESLYISGMGFTLTRFGFGPQLGATASYVWNDSSTGPSSYSLGTGLSASQILPTGGRLSVSAGLDGSRVSGPHLGDRDKGRSFGTNAGISLSQPLLRGFGKEIAWEGLVQSERSLVYSIRSFEIFRQNFCIDTAQQFFDLVRQLKSLDIEQKRYDDAVFDLKKAEALAQVDRNKPEDVFRTRRGEKTAKSQLIDAQTNLQRSLDSFKVELGLPVDTQIEIVEVDPPFHPVNLGLDSAIEVALVNRLDVHSLYDRLEDTERGLRITRNSLLPDLDLNLSYSMSDAAGRNLSKAWVNSSSPFSRSGSLSMSVPLQQKSERNSYRSALIGYEQQKRGVDETLDGIRNGIEDAIRQLKRIEEQIELQRDSIEQDTRNIRITQFRYERGEVDNRELLDARRAVADARIALNQEYANHFVRHLELQRDLGILFIDENGMWR